MMPLCVRSLPRRSAIFCRSGAFPPLRLRCGLSHSSLRSRVARRLRPRRQHLPAVVVEIAVIGRNGAVGDQPQPVGAGLDQVAVMADQDDGARKVVDRLGERRAAVDVEMVGRLVEDEEMRAGESREPQQQPRLLAARQVARPACRRLAAEKPIGAGAGAYLAPPARRASACGHGCRACRPRQFVELMLREIADLQLVGARHPRRQRRQPAGEQLDEAWTCRCRSGRAARCGRRCRSAGRAAEHGLAGS